MQKEEQKQNIFIRPDSAFRLSKNSKNMNIFIEIYHKRLGFQKQYVESLRSLLSQYDFQSYINNANANNQSQYLCNYLLKSINKQIQAQNQCINSIQEQIMPVLSTKIFDHAKAMKSQLKQLQQLDSQIKAQTEKTKSLLKIYIQKYENLKDFQAGYIVSSIRNKGFEKKNQICLQADKMKQKVNCSKSQYQKNAQKLRQLISNYTNKNQEGLKYLQTHQPQIMTNLMDTVTKNFHIFFNLQTILNDSSKYLFENIFEGIKRFESRIDKQEKTKIHQIPIQFDNNYINTLYGFASKPPELKRLEDLINLGNSQAVASDISQTNNPSSDISMMSYEQYLPQGDIGPIKAFTVTDIHHYFKQIFIETGSLEQCESIQKLTNLMKGSAECRKVFMLCFQTLRQSENQELELENMPKILKLINNFLNQCIKQNDIYNSKHLLVLSFAYFIKKDDKKMSLLQYIKNHRIWKDQEWWECAFLQSCFESLVACPHSKSNQADIITIWLIKGIGANQNLLLMSPRNRIFNYLDSYIFQMEEVGVNFNTKQRVGKRGIKIFELEDIFQSADNCTLKKYLSKESFHEVEAHLNSEGGFKNKIKKIFG